MAWAVSPITLCLLFQDAELENELRKKQEQAQREQALAQEAKRLEKVGVRAKCPAVNAAFPT